MTRLATVPVYWLGRVAALTLSFHACGCNAAQVPSRSWHFCFSTPEGQAVLLKTSSDRLFNGHGPDNREIRITTKDRTVSASSDPVTAQVLTVEQGHAHEYLRIYTEDGTLVAEREMESSGKPAFQMHAKLGPRARWLAYAGGKPFALLDIANLATCTPIDPLKNLPSRGSANRFAFYWLDASTLAIGVGDEAYVYDLESRNLRHVASKREGGYLCGVARGMLVGTSSDWDTWNLREIPKGRALGSASAHHTYAQLRGVSPCGEFVVYDRPGELFWPPKYVLKHLPSGKKILLNTPPQWRPGSWQEGD